MAGCHLILIDCVCGNLFGNILHAGLREKTEASGLHLPHEITSIDGYVYWDIMIFAGVRNLRHSFVLVSLL